MNYKSFDDLIKKVQNLKTIKKVAVVVADDEHTLEAVFKAKKDKIVNPVLIGNKEKIKAVLNTLGESLEDEFIFDVEDDNKAAYKAVELVNNGQVDFILKGKIQTADLLRAVVDKEKGLRTGAAMTHVAIHEIPSYHKLLVITDGGMMMYPDVDKKKQIIDNAVNTLLTMGYKEPKVAVVTAVENVNPKMPETIDADKLKKMNQEGIIKNCIVEGPIAYDLAMTKESAKIKGFESEVTGEADILVVPNITAGNLLSKGLIFSANAKMAGFVVGAKVPIALTSRGSSSEEKYLALVLCVCATK